jgi:hypothetical protein
MGTIRRTEGRGKASGRRVPVSPEFAALLNRESLRRARSASGALVTTMMGEMLREVERLDNGGATAADAKRLEKRIARVWAKWNETTDRAAPLLVLQRAVQDVASDLNLARLKTDNELARAIGASVELVKSLVEQSYPAIMADVRIIPADEMRDVYGRDEPAPSPKFMLAWECVRAWAQHRRKWEALGKLADGLGIRHGNPASMKRACARSRRKLQP